MSQRAWIWCGVLLLWLGLRHTWPFPQTSWFLTILMLYGVLFAGAVAIIGPKMRYVIDPEDALYRDGTGGWRWIRMRMAVPLLALMWGLSIGLAALLGAVGVHEAPLGAFQIVIVQIGLVGLGSELFFREGAMKVADGNPLVLVMLAVVAFGLVHWQGGPVAVMMGMGTGAIYLSARLIGVPILVVAVMHGLTNYVFTYTVWTAPDNVGLYGLMFMAGCFAIAVTVVRVVGPPDRWSVD